ncbi:MAG: T9SS type A sorting domain-containing protein [Chitinophagales bacterium]
MKYCLCSLITLLSIVGSAQRNGSDIQGTACNEFSSDNSRAVSDTIIPWGNITVTPRLYTSQNGGFITGVNGFGDLQFAQIFPTHNALWLTGAMYWFGGKSYTSGDTNSSVIFKVFALDSNNLSNNSGINKPGPGTLLLQWSVPLADIHADTSFLLGANYFQLPNPIHLDSAQGFVIGFDVSALAAGDTIGIMSTTDGDGTTKDLSIELWKNNSWNSFLDNNNWSLDFDLFIFALTDTIAPDTTVSNARNIAPDTGFKLFPNPSHNICQIQSTDINEINTISVYNSIGQQIVRITDIDNQTSVTIPTGDLIPGFYWVIVVDKKQSIAIEKMVVK